MDTIFSVPSMHPSTKPGEGNPPWQLSAKNIPSAWQETIGTYQGKSVKVAILDTGIDRYHPDLQRALPRGGDWYRDFSGGNDITDHHGHGTQVAGVLAAWPNTDTKTSGIAPGVELYVAKVVRHFADSGAPIGRDEELAQAIDWAVEKEVDIINLSVWSTDRLPRTHEAILRAYQQHIFVVCCAGNHYKLKDSIEFPAKYPETIAVGSVNQWKKVADFSAQGKELDVVAPGQGIATLDKAGGYTRVNGTSFAAPLVSGVMALMIAKHKTKGRYPNNTPLYGKTAEDTLRNVRGHLGAIALDLGAPGHDEAFGMGLIDPNHIKECIRECDTKGILLPPRTKAALPKVNRPDTETTAPKPLHGKGYHRLRWNSPTAANHPEGTHEVQVWVHAQPNCTIEGLRVREIDNTSTIRVLELPLVPHTESHAEEMTFSTIIGPRQPDHTRRGVAEKEFRILITPKKGLFTIGPDGGNGGTYGGENGGSNASGGG